jgi:hypothetical protein
MKWSSININDEYIKNEIEETKLDTNTLEGMLKRMEKDGERWEKTKIDKKEN